MRPGKELSVMSAIAPAPEPSTASAAAAAFPFPQRGRKTAQGKRGMVAVIAMMYLVLLGVLAIGAFEAVSMAVQISRNESKINASRAAVESGSEFMRYQLAMMNLPYGTTPGTLMTNLSNCLASALNGTGNMGSNTVQVTNGTIYLPSQAGWMTLDSSGTQFQLKITQPDVTQTTIVVTAHGRSSATGS